MAQTTRYPTKTSLQVTAVTKVGVGLLRPRLALIEAPVDATPTGLERLEEMRTHLALEGEELMRMEDEGGPPASHEQVGKAHACIATSHHISGVLHAARTASTKKNDSKPFHS